MATEPGSRSRVGGLVSAADDALRGTGNRVLATLPWLAPALLVVRDAYARGYVAARATANAVRYDAPVAPYRLVRVDPADVEFANGSPVAKFRTAGAVVGGDWDRTDTRFADTDVYRAYVRHFEEGVPWEETAFYDRIVDELAAGRERWGCHTEAEFRERCDRLDDLYDAIAERGYRSQEELRASDESDPIREQPRLVTERLKHEIAVHFDRHGRPQFDDGRNRLSIAKLLDLDSVPVRVLRRHERWQAVRDAYVRGEEWARDRGDHPDIRYLEFGSAGPSSGR
jgi:hypothetical protein